MKPIALVLSFIAMFGAAWMLCMRASDWRTDRWSRASRAYVLALGPMAWLLLILMVRNHIYQDNLRSDEMKIALFLGLPCGIAIYALLAWIRPGTAGARRVTLIARD